MRFVAETMKLGKCSPNVDVSYLDRRFAAWARFHLADQLFRVKVIDSVSNVFRAISLLQRLLTFRCSNQVFLS